MRLRRSRSWASRTAGTAESGDVEAPGAARVGPVGTLLDGGERRAGRSSTAPPRTRLCGGGSGVSLGAAGAPTVSALSAMPETAPYRALRESRRADGREARPAGGASG